MDGNGRFAMQKSEAANLSDGVKRDVRCTNALTLKGEFISDPAMSLKLPIPDITQARRFPRKVRALARV